MRRRAGEESEEERDVERERRRPFDFACFADSLRLGGPLPLRATIIALTSLRLPTTAKRVGETVAGILAVPSTITRHPDNEDKVSDDEAKDNEDCEQRCEAVRRQGGAEEPCEPKHGQDDMDNLAGQIQ